MSVEYKDYYKILGVGREASKDEIAKAFKKLARKYHTDLNPGNKESEEKFKEINEAYEVLKDEQKRKMYDQLGPNWQQGQQFGGNPFGGGNPYGGGTRFTFNGQEFGGQGFDGSGFSDFFETLFGSRQGGSAGGPFSGYTSRPQRGRHQDPESEYPRRGEGRRQAPPCRAGLRFAQRRAEGRSVFADTFRAAFVVPC